MSERIEDTMSLTPLTAFNDDHEQYAVGEAGPLAESAGVGDGIRAEWTNDAEQLAQAAALREWE
jgi:hypothetical protein